MKRSRPSQISSGGPTTNSANMLNRMWVIPLCRNADVIIVAAGMDGVLVSEEQAIPGAGEVISRLRETGTPFLVLTNNSIYTRRDLVARLRRIGLEVPEESIWTSALATARFLHDQRPDAWRFRRQIHPNLGEQSDGEDGGITEPLPAEPLPVSADCS